MICLPFFVFGLVMVKHEIFVMNVQQKSLLIRLKNMNVCART